MGQVDPIYEDKRGRRHLPFDALAVRPGGSLKENGYHLEGSLNERSEGSPPHER